MSLNTRIADNNRISKSVPTKRLSPVKKDKHVTKVIEGSFYQAKPITMREMITRKINKSLCVCLLLTIAITFVSYYISMKYEAKLNALDREIVLINNENQDLQADLDKFKSFNNVDNKVGEFKLLQKAENVLEITAMSTDKVSVPVEKSIPVKYSWAIGY